MNIGAKLRQWRESQHLSQEQLAEHLGVEKGTIWRWEKGERSPTGRNRRQVEELLAAEGFVHQDVPARNPPGDEGLILALWHKMTAEEKTALLVQGDAILKRRLEDQKKTG